MENNDEKVVSIDETAAPKKELNTTATTPAEVVEENCETQKKGECAETESPAEALSEATDALEGEETASGEEALTDEVAEVEKNYHACSKEELLEDLRQIVTAGKATAHKEVTAIKQAYYTIRNREVEKEMAAFVEDGNSPDLFAATPDPIEVDIKNLLAQFKEIRSAYLAQEEERRQENLSFKNKIIDQLRELADDIDNINHHFPKFQQLQQEFKEITDIPAGAVADTWKNYQLAVEQFYDRLKMNKELRDLDFKKNLEIKRQLIDEAKALESENDVVAAFRKLQDLHDKWRETGPVAKEIRESIWDEFKAISTVINKRHQEFFENRKAVEQENEEAKTKLCEEIESIDIDAINSFSDWDKTTKRIIELQNEWKKLGFASRKMNNVLFARFRKVCDDFFARKAEYFKKAKEDFAANLVKKTALCEEAEALKDAEDQKKAMDRVVELQAEWKKIGSVARKHSDAIWERFTKACNYFFEERKRRNQSQRQEENANLAAKRAVIDALKKIDTEEVEREEAISQVRELQAQWQKIGHVPYRQKDSLFAEYREVVDALYNSLNMKQSRARISNFEGKMNDLGSDGNKLGKERDRLVRALEARKAELNTCENNLGFFNVKSSAGNSMLQEMERKIKRLREDIAEIQQKIAVVDEKLD
jgi:hypothetical protein